MAECDLVTVIHKSYRQDPTAAAGTFYEGFTFDTFRIRNGKLVEHWDSAVINPPATAGSSCMNFLAASSSEASKMAMPNVLSPGSDVRPARIN